MLKLVIVGTIFAYTSARLSHPVTEEIIAEIKAKTQAWKPMEHHKNPFKDMEPEQIYQLLGGK
jgi:hypothetical protein